MLHLSWTQKVKNTQIRDKLNVRKDLVQMVMKRKLTLFGHIARMNNKRKIKTVMLGEMEGENRKGRPCKEWLDDTKEWCGKDVEFLSNVALDRNGWKDRVKRALDTYGLSANGK